MVNSQHTPRSRRKGGRLTLRSSKNWNQTPDDLRELLAFLDLTLQRSLFITEPVFRRSSVSTSSGCEFVYACSVEHAPSTGSIALPHRNCP